jgi:hypothetical protein
MSIVRKGMEVTAKIASRRGVRRSIGGWRRRR